MHECACKTILRARKSMHSNIKFVKPWFCKRVSDKDAINKNLAESSNSTLQKLRKISYITNKIVSHDNNAHPHGVCGAAGAVQRKRLRRFPYLMHHAMNLEENKNY